MRIIAIINLLLLLLSWKQLFAQPPWPEGCYKVIKASAETASDLKADTIQCLYLNEKENTSRWSGIAFCIHEKTLEEQSSSFSSNEASNEILSSWSSIETPIQHIAVSRGKSLFLRTGALASSRYYWQIGDTLWFTHLIEGELPIDFERGNAHLRDTIGLQSLLPAVGALAYKGQYSSIEIIITDSEVIKNTKKSSRLANRRFVVLQEQLKRGLGDVYTRVRFKQSASNTSVTRYTVTYHLY